MALAKAEGLELTKEEAEAYMAELEDCELDEAAAKQVAGGRRGGGGRLYKKAPEAKPAPRALPGPPEKPAV